MHFGASLRLVRVAAGMSLRDLGSAVGVSAAYLSRVEHGHDAPPTPDRLAAIAHALSVSPAVLRELAGVRAPAEASFAARALHDEVLRRRLSPAQIGRVLDFVERTFPEAPRAAGEVAALLAPGRVTRGVRATTLEDAVDVAVSRLGTGAEVPALAVAFRRVDLGTAAVGGGLVVVHVAEGARRASLALLDTPVPATTPDGRPVAAVLAMSGIGRDAAGLTTLTQAARLGEPGVLAAVRAAEDEGAAIEVVRLGEMGGEATLAPVGALR